VSVSLTRNWMAAMEAIAETIRRQNLSEIKSNVHVQATPFDGSDYRPGCYVTPTEVKASRTTTSRNDRGYGCRVTLIRGDAQSRGSKPEKTTEFEEFVNRLFHDKRLDMNLPTGHGRLPSKVDMPVDGADDKIAERLQQLEGVSLVVRVWIREKRA
jgi:hypothetical protein